MKIIIILIKKIKIPTFKLQNYNKVRKEVGKKTMNKVWDNPLLLTIRLKNNSLKYQAQNSTLSYQKTNSNNKCNNKIG